MDDYHLRLLKSERTIMHLEGQVAELQKQLHEKTEELYAVLPYRQAWSQQREEKEFWRTCTDHLAIAYNDLTNKWREVEVHLRLYKSAAIEMRSDDGSIVIFDPKKWKIVFYGE